jgi:hypothetical protein
MKADWGCAVQQDDELQPGNGWRNQKLYDRFVISGCVFLHFMRKDKAARKIPDRTQRYAYVLF